MKFRKVLAASLALLLAASLPLGTLAETYDLAAGSITVEAKADGNQYVSQDGGVQDEIQTTETVITQDKSASATTDKTITIKAEEKTNADGSKEKMTAEVTISGVNLDVSNTGNVSTGTAGEAAISTGGDGNVTIELDGDNTLQSGKYRAGLEKNNGGNLTVEDENDNGSLNAVGGGYGAGIGGGFLRSGTDITITGGNVTASGGDFAAGIGGGGNYVGSALRGDGADITITGGNVIASGGMNGAGIGGGRDGSGTDITIAGGNVTATGGNAGAGIGGGTEGDGTNITITGGRVAASSSGMGAGIGGGSSRGGSNITITGGNVTASSDFWGAGIGGGYVGDGTDISITGGNVTASSDEWGAGIGGGGYGDGTDITVSGNAQVKVSGSDGASDIGGGKGGNGEIVPDTSELGDNGSISYFVPGADMTTANPEKLLHKTANGTETHEHVFIKSKADPACSITYACSCGEEVTQGNSAIPHSFTNYVPQNDATCEKDGTKVAKCDYGCGAERVLPDAGTKLNHALVKYPAKAATCTEIGWKAYEKCTRSGCTYTTYSEEKINPDNHDLKHYDAKEATCTERGWDAYDTCTRCSYSTYVEKPIDPNNHDLEHHDGKEPTCTEDGWEEYDTCKRKGCTYTTYQKINALNHSFTKYVYQNDATCLEDGKEIAHCDHSGCTETDVRTAAGTALGHRFTDYVYNGDADYASDGTETAQCDHGCGETDTRPAEGTRLAIYWVTDEAGKTIAASESRSGSVLTITVNQESATLSGTTAGLRVLQARGITTIVFVTASATSTFNISDLLTGTSYRLTHSGTAVGFTLDGTDILKLLK